VTLGESVTFPVDSTDLSYPVYFKESLLNSNLGFDYGEFLQLETAIFQGKEIDMFIFTFYEAGVYVFWDSKVNNEYMIISVLDDGRSCPADLKASAQTYRALYSTNMMSGESTHRVNLTVFLQVIINSFLLMIGMVATIVFVYGLNKRWGLFDCCKKKSAKALQEEEAEKERIASILNSEELKEIWEELRKHIAALKFRLAELAEEWRRRAEERKLADLDDDDDRIYKTLKTYIWKRAKLIW